MMVNLITKSLKTGILATSSLLLIAVINFSFVYGQTQEKSQEVNRERKKNISRFLDDVQQGLGPKNINLTQKKNELLKIVSQIRKRLKQFNTEIASLKKANQRLRKQIGEIKTKAQRAVNLEEKLQAQIKENKKLTEKIVALKQDKELQATSLAKFSLDNRKLKEELNQLNQKIKGYQQELSAAQAERQEVEIQMEEALRRGKEIKEKAALLGEDSKDLTEKKLNKTELFKQHYNKGLFYDQLGEYNQALREYKKALELMPEDPDTHYNMGLIYDDYIIDKKKAIFYYLKYLELDPDSPARFKVKTWINKAKEDLKWEEKLK